jgi:arylsulfatase A-like enzyme
MSPRRFLSLRSLALLGTGALCAAASAAPARPNLLLIVADDLGYADVGFNGGTTIRTPNLDRLAATGVNLTDFRACPMCSPTRAGLMTGRWPLRVGIMRAVIPPWSPYGLPPAEQTLPERLAPAGYERRGIVGKWHLGHARREYLPLAQGFTRFYGHYNGAIDYFTHEREGEVDWHDDERTVKQEGYATDLLATEAVRFIRESSPGRPWFLYVPFNAPHSPFQAKPEDLARYPQLAGVHRVYAAMVDALDQAVGRILAAVEARSDAANTLILFHSDNGGIPSTGSSNAPFRGEKLGVYEGGTRVCAALRWPAGGLAGGGKFPGRIGYIDVLPTFLSAAGVTAPGNLDGLDFLPALRGTAPLPPRPWFSYIHQGADAHASVHLGPQKLVAHGDFFAAAPAAPPALELYDLAADPAERQDLAAREPARVADLHRRLREFGTWQQPGVAAYAEGREGFVPPADWIVGGPQATKPRPAAGKAGKKKQVSPP